MSYPLACCLRVAQLPLVGHTTLQAFRAALNSGGPPSRDFIHHPSSFIHLKFSHIFTYNPKDGKFIMGLQFHPERMRHPDSDEFDYPGCSMAYQEFVKAVTAYEKRLSCSALVPRARKLSEELELKRKVILKSFSIARDIYNSDSQMVANQYSELEAGADFPQPFGYARWAYNYYIRGSMTMDMGVVSIGRLFLHCDIKFEDEKQKKKTLELLQQPFVYVDIQMTTKNLNPRKQIHARMHYSSEPHAKNSILMFAFS
ncbi:hypothetical protein SESBI_24458 [Sesbania bispinosa]|nr:hypothetical protein SESBI_24458 [Sesbania bispinosa]